QIADIYMPPGDRKVLARKLKKEPKAKDSSPAIPPAKIKPKANVTTGITEVDEEEDDDSQYGYIEVEHEDNLYYIDNHATNPNETPLTYFVYTIVGEDEELELAGH